VNDRVVCDASAIVAVLLDGGPAGTWATGALTGADLLAPSLLTYEVGNIIRRHELAGTVSSDQASQAHADLLDLAIDHWPYELMATRIWQLRRNLTVYDASYVAVAEATKSTLVTLDRAIAGAPGVRCAVATPV
jgi:predicted nucleic acid-binding protein